MATYMVERYLPGITWEGVLAGCARGRDAAVRLVDEVVGVRYVRSAFVPAEESVFCLFEGGSPEAVRRVIEAAAFPFERIQEVLVVTADELVGRGRHA